MKESLIGTVYKHQGSQNKIFLCSDLLTHFTTGEKITLSFGQAKAQGRVYPLQQKKSVMISANLWQKLAIPYAQQVHFLCQPQQLRLGPLVGIFTAGIHPGSTQLVGRRTSLMQRYLLAQEKVPLTYFVFGPADISYAQKQINGYFLRKKNGRNIWRRYKVPFPDVVFNRLPNRSIERIVSVKKAKLALESSGVKIFNPHFFNKWTLHKHIYHVQKIEPFLPQTILRPSAEQLRQLLRKYRMIYLKPAGGSLGLGIIQLYLTRQGILARYRGREHNQLKRFSTLSEVMSYFFDQRSITRYIAQQGIPLIQIQNRPIDFRIHTNKDRYGQWKMTACAAKMAGKGSVTTHMRTGGKVLSAAEVLKLCFPHQYNEVQAKLESAVLLLSEAIDDRVPGYIGELGFDIGIDQTGHPWMFEANAKPGRHVFAHRSMREDERLTRQMILEYALFLADFSSAKYTETQVFKKGGQT